MDTYELGTVFESPELVLSLAQFAELRQVNQEVVEAKADVMYGNTASVLFLRIQAAADYFTMNQTLMQEVPPVHVDIILDPFILNIVPRSLIPTAIYITIIAIGSWVLSKSVNRWIRLLSIDTIENEKKVS